MMAARPVAAAGRCGQPGLARARDDFQLGGMLKIPLFAAPAVKFRKTVVRLLRSSQSARAVTVKTHLHHS
jgi:hypothetical protein